MNDTYTPQVSVQIHNDRQKKLKSTKKVGGTNSHNFLYYVVTAFANVSDLSYLSYYQSSRTFLILIFLEGVENFLSLEPVKGGDICG
jgi:hypothetical protein